MDTKYNAAALAFALLATSSVAMNASTTSSTVFTAKAVAAEENVNAVNPVKNEFYRLFRVRKTFIATKNGIVLKQNAAALPNLPNKVFKVYKVGETVALNSKGYDKYGFYIKPHLDCLIALKAAK
ncbi:hypothetical protein [Ruminococcus sp.]|jgi:hypothetical protein|uniref:hypothetical protein n=1 Tax=Ruminococcus sp. TaxID=41978 RepID=UPI0025F6507B|nr:hypothetical protein [Ruminococcus sp.]